MTTYIITITFIVQACLTLHINKCVNNLQLMYIQLLFIYAKYNVERHADVNNQEFQHQKEDKYKNNEIFERFHSQYFMVLTTFSTDRYISICYKHTCKWVQIEKKNFFLAISINAICLFVINKYLDVKFSLPYVMRLIGSKQSIFILYTDTYLSVYQQNFKNSIYIFDWIRINFFFVV